MCLACALFAPSPRIGCHCRPRGIESSLIGIHVLLADLSVCPFRRSYFKCIAFIIIIADDKENNSSNNDDDANSFSL